MAARGFGLEAMGIKNKTPDIINVGGFSIPAYSAGQYYTGPAPIISLLVPSSNCLKFSLKRCAKCAAFAS